MKTKAKNATREFATISIDKKAGEKTYCMLGSSGSQSWRVLSLVLHGVTPLSNGFAASPKFRKNRALNPAPLLARSVCLPSSDGWAGWPSTALASPSGMLAPRFLNLHPRVLGFFLQQIPTATEVTQRLLPNAGHQMRLQKQSETNS